MAYIKQIACPHCGADVYTISSYWLSSIDSTYGLDWVIQKAHCDSCKQIFYIESHIDKVEIKAERPPVITFFTSV